MHTLPISGYIVELNDEPTFGQMQDLENFYQNNAKGKIGANGAVDTNFDGAVISKYNDLVMLTFIKSLKTKEEVAIDVSIDAIRKLHFRDGQELQRLISELQESLKKK